MNTFMSPKRARDLVDEYDRQQVSWECDVEAAGTFYDEDDFLGATAHLRKPVKSDVVLDAEDLLREFRGLQLRALTDRNEYGLPVGELFGYDIPEYGQPVPSSEDVCF